MSKYLSTVLAIAALVTLGGVALYAYNVDSSASYGVTVNPVTPAVFETYLANAEGTPDTSLTLASGALRDGTSLSGYVCLTIDSNTSALEYECGTASGTTVSGLLRGLDATTGTTSVPALIFAHRRGADVKVTDYPTLTILNNQLSGIQSIGVPIFYDSSVASSTIASNMHNLVDVDLLNSTSFSGSPNASAIVKGIVQLATGLQAGSSTALGSTGAALVIPASIATDTPNTNTNKSDALISDLTGHLKQGWLDLASLWTFAGGLTSTATTTLAASNVLSNALKINTVPYAWPGSQGVLNTVLTNDGAGNLTWSPTKNSTLSVSSQNLPETNTSTTSLKTVTVPANSLSATAAIRYQAYYYQPGGAGTCQADIGFGNGSATTSMVVGNVAQSASFVGEVMATSSSAGSTYSTGTLQGNYGTNVTPTLAGINQSIAYNFAVQTYISFGARCASGQVNLEGETVELLNN